MFLEFSQGTFIWQWFHSWAGLNSMVPDEEIFKILEESPEETVCSDLITGANEAGGYDNITVVVASIGA
jgi:serine/threonine protein phosphatase PrpC